ncbi:tetratricopeptide repeat protein [Lysobacter tyrosinilyticus]
MNLLRTACAGLLLATTSVAIAAPTNASKPDATKMWADFLAKADDESLNAFDALEAVGYEGDEVDAKLCADNTSVLAAAVKTIPVSLGIRRAAYLCADATGDAPAAESELQVLAALSRHALKQAGDPSLAKPIRIVAPVDAYALLRSSGMEQAYEYYLFARPARYFPLVVVGWDADAKIERHYAFDYVDTLLQLKNRQPFAGTPIMRAALADAYVKASQDTDGLAAVDIAAIRAGAASARGDKVAKLRGAATAGGIQSAKAWLLVCSGRSATPDCTEGLVDALMQQAESKNAFAMSMLAYAYLEGIGTKADPKSAWLLLDAADRRWPQGALLEFADVWVSAHDRQPLPKELDKRLARAAAAGNRPVKRLLLGLKAAAEKPQLSDSDIAFLASPELNGRGLGYGLLVDYYKKLKQPHDVWKWTVLGAEAGNATLQSWYASALIYGDQTEFKRDLVKGVAMAQAAAHGGDAWGALEAARRSRLDRDFKAAEGWLMGPADVGDIDSFMALAALYAEDQPGLSGDAKRAVELYGMLASDKAQGAPARRALAQLAIAGHGMAKDPSKALQWLKEDAEQGDHDSELQLGSHYLLGDFGKVDEAEGTRWMRRAMKGGIEDAYTLYSSWLYYNKNTDESRKQALALLAEADAAGNTGATNNYAWTLCTSPRADIFDPKRGLDVSRKLGDVDVMGAGAIDTVAACYAANGDFKKAVELQERAAKVMAALETPDSRKKLGDKVPGYQKRLALYRDGKRYQEFDRNN